MAARTAFILEETMTRLSALLTSVCGLAAAAFVHGAALAADPVTLKIAHFLPPNSSAQKQVMEPWCERLGAESNGQIKCQIYPALQLGGTPAQLVDLARNGVADIVWTAPGYSAGRFPLIEALELPFVIKGGLSGSRAAWAFYEQYAAKDFAAYKVLALHVDGGVSFHTAGREVTDIESLKGLKLRASTRMVSKMLTTLGATPVNMPPAQLTEAIGKGVVDGAMATWEVVFPTKLQEVTKFHSDPPAGKPFYAATVLSLLMNKAKYDSLSPDLKQVLDRNSGPALVDLFGTVWDQVAADSKTKTQQEGGKLIVQTDAAYDAMIKASAGVEDEWVKELAARGIDAAPLAKAARSLAAQ